MLHRGLRTRRMYRRRKRVEGRRVRSEEKDKRSGARVSCIVFV